MKFVDFYKCTLVTELRKKEQSFLYVTHCLDLIHMAIKFHSIWLPSYGRHKDSAKKIIKGK